MEFKLNKSKKLELLYKMMRIRAIEESIALEYSKQKMRCPVHLSIGQEAVAVGVCEALNNIDFAVSTHRSHAHYLAKGGDLRRMLAELHGKETGCSKGRGGSMHLIDLSVNFEGSTAIVGNSIPIGVGLGLSIRLKKQEDVVSCIFIGDAAVEEGIFYESVNFAIVKKLPVIFICENNLYSVYSSLDVRQPKGRKIHTMVGAMGLQTFYGDGNDISEIFTKTCKALENIKNGKGPQFLEFSTYRWREHCGPNFDNNIGYRSEEEFMSWKKNDPIVKLEKVLATEEPMLVSKIKSFNDQISTEVREAFIKVENDNFPDPDSFNKYVYK